MLNLSLNELKLLTKKRGIIGYKSMCKERSLSALSESESVESKSLKKIREDFNELRDRFSKPQIKEITKNLSKQKIKEIEGLFKLEDHLFNFKKYHFQDDFKCKSLGDKKFIQWCYTHWN